MTHTVIFTGYLAELVALQAERRNLTPEDYIRSFFPDGAMHRDTSTETHIKKRRFLVERGALRPRK